MGAVYVCEGARLGGRVLSRRVEAGLGLTPAHGAAYLAGEGAAAGARWRDFVAELNRAVTTPRDGARALHAARAVFALIIARYEED
jgi:heme oxygenase